MCGRDLCSPSMRTVVSEAYLSSLPKANVSFTCDILVRQRMQCLPYSAFFASERECVHSLGVWSRLYLILTPQEKVQPLADRYSSHILATRALKVGLEAQARASACMVAVVGERGRGGTVSVLEVLPQLQYIP